MSNKQQKICATCDLFRQHYIKHRPCKFLKTAFGTCQRDDRPHLVRFTDAGCDRWTCLPRNRKRYEADPEKIGKMIENMNNKLNEIYEFIKEDEFEDDPTVV